MDATTATAATDITRDAVHRTSDAILDIMIRSCGMVDVDTAARAVATRLLEKINEADDARRLYVVKIVAMAADMIRRHVES